jgi:hypothetical protein
MRQRRRRRRRRWWRRRSVPLLQRALDVPQRAAGRAHLDDLELHPPARCGSGRRRRWRRRREATAAAAAASGIAIARLLSGVLL